MFRDQPGLVKCVTSAVSSFGLCELLVTCQINIWPSSSLSPRHFRHSAHSTRTQVYALNGSVLVLIGLAADSNMSLSFSLCVAESSQFNGWQVEANEGQST